MRWLALVVLGVLVLAMGSPRGVGRRPPVVEPAGEGAASEESAPLAPIARALDARAQRGEQPARAAVPVERPIAELGQELHAAADRADLRTVIARFLELLQRGEEGYAEAATLLVELAQDEQSPLALWDDSARAAYVYPAILAHPEECLRFLLYLGQRDEDTLEEPLRRLAHALRPGNRVVAMLLVNYDGHDPGLWHEYLDRYQAELAPDAEDYEFVRVVRAIENIPVDEAAVEPQTSSTSVSKGSRLGSTRSCSA